MQLQLEIIGGFFILLAAIHVVFPKYFNWKQELKTLSLVNKQMMLVHTFFIALTVFLMGILCITASNDIITTALGHKISLGFAIFWAIRLLIQFFGYSSKLWKGKLFETSIHITFTIIWAYLSVFFFQIYFS